MIILALTMLLSKLDVEVLPEDVRLLNGQTDPYRWTWLLSAGLKIVMTARTSGPSNNSSHWKAIRSIHKSCGLVSLVHLIIWRPAAFVWPSQRYSAGREHSNTKCMTSTEASSFQKKSALGAVGIRISAPSFG
jgi:hypothetical protein